MIAVLVVPLTIALLAWHWSVWAVACIDLLVYAVWAYNHPWRKCWACGGTGQNGGSTKRRWGKCWRCKGSREIRTLGSRALHRLVRSVQEHIRDRKGW
jgi:hypothetical protein